MRGVRGWLVCLATVGLLLVAGGCTEGVESVEEAADRTEQERPEPAPTSEEKPVEPKPAVSREKMKTPWARAKVGDYVVVRTHLPGGRAITKKFVITATDERTVTMQIQDPETGEVSRTETIDLAVEDARYVDPLKLDGIEVADETLEVGGKKLACKRVTREFGENKVVTWYCFDVPILDGVIRSIRNGELAQEVVELSIGE